MENILEMGKVTELEAGWSMLRSGMTKFVDMLETDLNHNIALDQVHDSTGQERYLNAEDYSAMYTLAYSLCCQINPSCNYAHQLYAKVKDYIEEQVALMVLPATMRTGTVCDQHVMLRDLVKRWANCKLVLLTEISRIFTYVDMRRNELPKPRKLRAPDSLRPSLYEVGISCLQDVVYSEVRHKARAAVVSFIHRERADGEQIHNKALIKNAIGIFLDAGHKGSLEPYTADIEAFLLNDAVEYYRGMASSWVEKDSCPAYMRRAEECLKRERERVAQYLHASSEAKLVQSVLQELFPHHIRRQVLDKEDLGCRALLRDINIDKLEDLSRIYGLLRNVDDGLDEVLSIFKEHLADAHSAIVKQVEADLRAAASLTKEDNSTAPSHKQSAAELEAQLSFVCKLIELHDTYSLQVVAGCFRKSSSFQNAFREAFEALCNQRLNIDYSCSSTISTSSIATAANYNSNSKIHTAELLAMFCDHLQLARTGSSSASNIIKIGYQPIIRLNMREEEKIEDSFKQVVHILASYVSDKDVFAEVYKRKLGRRLLVSSVAGGRSGSANSTDVESQLHHERSFVSMLKQQCGSKLTSSMEGMLKDITLAVEKQAAFRAYQDIKQPSNTDIMSSSRNNNITATSSKADIDVRVTVLTSRFWPSLKPLDSLTLPPEMVQCTQTFEDFYRAKNHKHKLRWIHSMGTCQVLGSFDVDGAGSLTNSGAIYKEVELEVTTLQAAVLLLFNSRERLTCAELKAELNLADEQAARRLLHSLASSKHKILRISVNAENKDDAECFEFNAEFSSRTRRVKIPPPTIISSDRGAASEQERRKVIEDCHHDRRYTVDACLARIMKSRKVLPFQQLVAECVEQLSGFFKPDIKLVKKRIEELMKRDYLKRDAHDPHLLHYLA